MLLLNQDFLKQYLLAITYLQDTYVLLRFKSGKYQIYQKFSYI